MFSEAKVTEIYCMADGFAKNLPKYRKRALIETGNDELKSIAQIEHSRHRSFNNFIANLLSAIIAYCFFEKKRY